MLSYILQSGLLALFVATPFMGFSEPAAGPTKVVTVQAIAVADLVLLSNGFDAGLRRGMVCRVTRSEQEIAEIILVDLRPTCASALIVGQSPGQAIRAGDLASVKILKT